MKNTGPQRAKLETLKPNPKNPRVIKDDKFQKLVQSIRAFPQMLEVRPIVCTPDGVVLGGNMRLRACKEAGLREVPVHVVSWLDSQQEEFIIKDNVGYGEWDWDILANEWDANQLEDWGLDVWTPEAEPEEGLTDPDEVPSVPEEPKTKPGDLYILGKHRLLCGDSTNAEHVARLMDGETPEIILTDPPYSSGGNQESGKTVGSIGARGNGKKLENDNLSTRGYVALMDRVIANLRDAHTAFVFCDWKMWAVTQDCVESRGLRVRNMIVWDKIQMGMGMPFRNQHELCLFGSRLAGKIADGKTSNVIQCSRDREAEHATPKPIELLERLIKQVESDTITDPFAGGGSAFIAAEKTGRTCYGMELDPKYCDVIVKRWENFTGKKAELVS
jgi:DNA modification methylase